MEIQVIQDQKKYLDFLKIVYKRDAFYKDNKTDLFYIVCSQKGEFYKRSKQKMISVIENGKILCQSVFIIHNDNSEHLCLSFFEALENQKDAVNFLVNYAEKYAVENNCNKIIVSLEGHCNNGLSFALDKNQMPGFGESYNPVYYNDYFESFNKIKLNSYFDKADLVASRIEEDVCKYKNIFGKFCLEYASFKNRDFINTMKIYTDLNNVIFKSHRYYHMRNYEEDIELFKDMRLLLRPENLIFVKKDEDYIGFILWYHDYNELVKKGKKVGVIACLKYKLLNVAPKKVKVVEIGVLPKFRRYGIILMLFDAAIKCAQKISPKSEKIISSWILDENNKSNSITLRYTKNKYKGFAVYEKEIS